MAAAVTPPNSRAPSPGPLPPALDSERLCLQHFTPAVIGLLTEFLGHDLRQWTIGAYDKWSEDVPRGVHLSYDAPNGELNIFVVHIYNDPPAVLFGRQQSMFSYKDQIPTNYCVIGHSPAQQQVEGLANLREALSKITAEDRQGGPSLGGVDLIRAFVQVVQQFEERHGQNL